MCQLSTFSNNKSDRFSFSIHNFSCVCKSFLNATTQKHIKIRGFLYLVDTKILFSYRHSSVCCDEELLLFFCGSIGRRPTTLRDQKWRKKRGWIYKYTDVWEGIKRLILIVYWLLHPQTYTPTLYQTHTHAHIYIHKIGFLSFRSSGWAKHLNILLNLSNILPPSIIIIFG